MADQMFLTEEIKKKWAPVIDHADVPAIKETWKKRVTTIMLENTAREISKSQQLNEDAPANAAGAFPNATNLKGFDPILISLIRRAMPNLLAYDLCGVQPMTGPTGLIFALKSRTRHRAERKRSSTKPTQGSRQQDSVALQRRRRLSAAPLVTPRRLRTARTTPTLVVFRQRTVKASGPSSTQRVRRSRRTRPFRKWRSASTR
jgi:hypothetical protein